MPQSLSNCGIYTNYHDAVVIYSLQNCMIYFSATVFNNANQHINVYGDDIEVDYRGYEVGGREILLCLGGSSFSFFFTTSIKNQDTL